jgi:DNA-directed RNA polymerase subunit H (RpoH/RPB5)
MRRAFEVCKEMMLWRGHTITESTEPWTIRAETASGGLVECKFFFEPKLNINILLGFLQKSTLQKFEQIVIVGKQILPCNSTKTTRANKNVEIFTVDELQQNVMVHCYQPKFEKITNQEFLKTFSKNGWPIMIADTDRVARFMRYQKGDVIRITRDGVPNYRIVM